MIHVLLVQVVLIHVGVTSVIAHIKIGQMHAALESKVLVVSAQGQSTNARVSNSSQLFAKSTGGAEFCLCRK